MKNTFAYYLTLFFLIIVVPTNIFAQNNHTEQTSNKHVSSISDDVFIEKITESLRLYTEDYPIEKVYLHTDKELVFSGEKLWYSAYIIQGHDHNKLLTSKILYIDLVDTKGNSIISQRKKVDKGKSSGNITIPKNIPLGDYQLRAYTKWMLNMEHNFLFTKRIKVIGVKTPIQSHDVIAKNEVDLQFFPESGNAVEGIPGIIAFKAINKNGLGIDVNGTIVDSKGNLTASFKTQHRGAGYFYNMPKPGEEYTAITQDGKHYKLPKAISNGYTMSVNASRQPDVIKVKIQASLSLRNKLFYIIGHIRNKKYYHVKFEFKGKDVINFEIPKNKIPNGILTLTLFDENKTPWCERLIFVKNTENLIIKSHTNTPVFGKRDKIKLNIETTNAEGFPILTDLSVSVTHTSQIQRDKLASNIWTYLLMESDLKGHIEYPGELFKDNKAQTLSKLDLVMLTHGWRKLKWQEILNKKPFKKPFHFENNYTLSGTVKKYNNKPLVDKKIKAIVKANGELSFYETKTNKIGQFQISNFDLNDSIDISFNIFNKKQKLNDFKIELDNQKPTLHFTPPLSNHMVIKTAYKQLTLLQWETDSIYNTKINKLDEVIIRARNKKEKEEKEKKRLRGGPPSTYGIHVSEAHIAFSEDFGDYPNSISFMLNSIAGVNARGSSLGNLKVSIRGSNIDIDGKFFAGYNPNPLWVVDGIPQQEQPSYLDQTEIQRIEVLKGADASVFGVRGANGVILIYTKQGGEEKYSKNKRKSSNSFFTIEGYTSEKEFYTPKYDSPIDEHIKPDHRAVLYWNPRIITDKNGNATVTFYNSDETGPIQVVIEGISEDGTPGVFIQNFGGK